MLIKQEIIHVRQKSKTIKNKRESIINLVHQDRSDPRVQRTILSPPKRDFKIRLVLLLLLKKRRQAKIWTQSIHR